VVRPDCSAFTELDWRPEPACEQKRTVFSFPKDLAEKGYDGFGMLVQSHGSIPYKKVFLKHPIEGMLPSRVCTPDA